MFDLDQHISDWRRQMLAAGIKLPVPLEELEIHLREEIEQQMKLGLNEQQALEIAIQRIGQPKVLKSEFQRASALPKHAAKYICAVSGILLLHGLRGLFHATVHPPAIISLGTIWCLRIVFLLTITTAILFFFRPRKYWMAAFSIVGFYVILFTVALVVCYPSTTIAVKLKATVPPFALSLFTLFCLSRAKRLDVVARRNGALEPTATDS